MAQNVVPTPSSTLLKLRESAESSVDRGFDADDLNLTVVSIKHYVLDGSSTHILYPDLDDKTKVIPFDGYNLTISDGVYKTEFATANFEISKMIQKSQLRPGRTINRMKCCLRYAENQERPEFFLILNLKMDENQNNNISADSFDNLTWLPVDGFAQDQRPLLCLRDNFLSVWNVTDPYGQCWEDVDNFVPIINDLSDCEPNKLTANLEDPLAKRDDNPMVVRVFAKSRLDYYPRKHQKMDLNACPYQFDCLVGDEKSCCLAVFWGSLAVKCYKKISIGSVLVLRKYRVKVAFKQEGYSAFCFDPSLRRFKFEVSLEIRQNQCPFDIVDDSVLDENLPIPNVPFLFLSTDTIETSVLALNKAKLDFVGMIVHLGRWNRESRRYFRNVVDSDIENRNDDAKPVEGLLVSTLSGDEYLEEFHTGGYWMWRWLVLSDGDSKFLRVKCYSLSQPDVESALKPGNVVVITQLQLQVVNKSNISSSKSLPKWIASTTNESQIIPVSGDHFQAAETNRILKDIDQVKNVLEYSKTSHSMALSFGGSYDFPNYPNSFDELLLRYKANTDGDDDNSKFSNNSHALVVGPVQLANRDFAVLLNNLTFLEHRAVMVPALLCCVNFIPLDKVVSKAMESLVTTDSNQSPKQTNKKSTTSSKNSLSLILSPMWQERSINCRALGTKNLNWRSPTW